MEVYPMKTRSKIFLLTLGAVLLVTATIIGTIAFLTAQDEVVNTFTVGDVQITLDETAVNEDGTPIANANRVKQNDYHLIPGNTYVKDPTVTVKADSEPSYVRMLVTITNYTEMKAAFGDNFLPQNYVDGTWDPAVWAYEATTQDTANDTITYEFRYHEIVTAGNNDKELEPLFTKFVLPGTVTAEDLRNLADGFDISVVAHAIQASTFNNAQEAWDAFDLQYQNANP